MGPPALFLAHSEQNLQRKLNLPRSSHDRRNRTGVGVRSAAAIGAQVGHREVEIGVIENIKEFRAKLDKASRAFGSD